MDGRSEGRLHKRRVDEALAQLSKAGWNARKVGQSLPELVVYDGERVGGVVLVAVVKKPMSEAERRRRGGRWTWKQKASVGAIKRRFEWLDFILVEKYKVDLGQSMSERHATARAMKAAELRNQGRVVVLPGRKVPDVLAVQGGRLAAVEVLRASGPNFERLAAWKRDHYKAFPEVIVLQAE